MPLYDCECASGSRFERIIPLSEFEAPIICACGRAARRVISLSTIIGGKLDYEYSCPVTGKHIVSKRQHEENLKAHQCRVLETGEREFNERQRASADQEFEKKVEATVEREVATMPSEKREALGKELERGVTAEVTRG